MSLWLHSDRTVAVFSDSTLETATVIHAHGCRAAANDSGIAPMVLCHNRFCTQHQLTKRTPVLELARTHDSVLVRTQTSGPFWVEPSVLKPCSAPTVAPEKRSARTHTILLPPPDFLMVDTLLGHGPLKLPRRRRPLKGGEVVFVRSQLQDKSRQPTIWRFFALSFVDHTPVALVIDASIPFDGALNPGWAQCRPLPLVRDGKTLKPEQLLIPAFPLPDGREDPGWRSEVKA